MAEITLVPSSIALTSEVLDSFVFNDDIVEEDYETGYRWVPLLYAYRSYTAKNVTSNYADIELSNPVEWEIYMREEDEDDEGTSFDYVWRLNVPSGAYLVIGGYHYGMRDPETPSALTIRVYRNPADGSAAMNGKGYAYQTESIKKIEFRSMGYRHRQEYASSYISVPSGDIAYALCLAGGGGGISVSVDGAVRNASDVVCVDGVIRTASMAVSVGGIIKT